MAHRLGDLRTEQVAVELRVVRAHHDRVRLDGPGGFQDNPADLALDDEEIVTRAAAEPIASFNRAIRGERRRHGSELILATATAQQMPPLRR